MSILEKCERIGLELRMTPEGKKAFDSYKHIKSISKDIAVVELFKLINKNSVKLHFFAVENAIDIFEANKDVPNIKRLVDAVLAIDGLKEFGEYNTHIGMFVQRLDSIATSNAVHYKLPDEITATPKLIRLCNSLAVECQRINLLQGFIREYFMDPDFKKAIARFDQLTGAKRIVPFSREDRTIFKELKKEFPNSKIDLIHNFITILIYIKCVVFDSFYDNMYEVNEDVIRSYREFSLNGCKYIKVVLEPSLSTLDLNRGWILKLYNKKGVIRYAQIFSKKLQWSRDEDCSITIRAILHQGL